MSVGASSSTLRFMPKSRPTVVVERDEATGVERLSGTWNQHRTQKHAHPEYQFTVSDAGTGRLTYLGGEMRIPPGCAVFVHAGEPHVLENRDRTSVWALRSLHIPAAFVDGAGAPLHQPIPLRLDGALERAFSAVWRTFRTSGAEPALRALGATLMELPGLEPEPRPRTLLVRRATEYLSAILDRRVSGTELARKVGVSSERLRRIFSEATGLPPHLWHLQRRLVEAKHRLRAGASPGEAAHALGFSDQAHFTRQFKALVGVSPSAYVVGSRAETLSEL